MARRLSIFLQADMPGHATDGLVRTPVARRVRMLTRFHPHCLFLSLLGEACRPPTTSNLTATRSSRIIVTASPGISSAGICVCKLRLLADYRSMGSSSAPTSPSLMWSLAGPCPFNTELSGPYPLLNVCFCFPFILLYS